MQISLHQKNVLVTGASRGIGLGIAKKMLEAGAKVLLHHNRPSENITALQNLYPEQAFSVSANLSQVSAVEQLFEAAIAQLGGVDVLVNNAGIAIESPIEAPERNWLEDWQQTMQVNLTAAALLSRKVILHLTSHKKKGRLIHIASRAAFRGDTLEYIAYAASKGGLVAMSHSLARAYGKQGIASFVVAPGFTQTDMAQDFIEKYGEQHALHDIVLPTLTQPEDIAPMVVLLASGLADHATGTSISINAGSYIR